MQIATQTETEYAAAIKAWPWGKLISERKDCKDVAVIYILDKEIVGRSLAKWVATTPDLQTI